LNTIEVELHRKKKAKARKTFGICCRTIRGATQEERSNFIDKITILPLKGHIELVAEENGGAWGGAKANGVREFLV